MNRELLQKALDIIKKSRSGYGDDYHSEDERNVMEALKAELAKPEQDWDLLKATQDSLREHMSKVKELETKLITQTILDKKADNARELGLDYEPELTREQIYEKILKNQLAEPYFDMPDSHIVKWSIPVDPNNFGEPLANPEQGPVKIHCPSCLHSFAVLPVAEREWVGLTDEEIDELHGSPMSLEHSAELKWVRKIEAKLKDKNNAV